MLDPFAPDPDALTDHELEAARWHRSQVAKTWVEDGGN